MRGLLCGLLAWTWCINHAPGGSFALLWVQGDARPRLFLRGERVTVTAPGQERDA